MIWHPVVVGSADSTLDNRKNIGGVRRTNRRREQLLSFIESKSKRDEKIYPWLPESIEPADVMTSDVTRQKSQFDIWSPLNSTLPCSPLQSRGPGQIVNIICSTTTQQTGNLGPSYSLHRAASLAITFTTQYRNCFAIRREIDLQPAFLPSVRLLK